jgi:hypothetical protein
VIVERETDCLSSALRRAYGKKARRAAPVGSRSRGRGRAYS